MINENEAVGLTMADRQNFEKTIDSTLPKVAATEVPDATNELIPSTSENENQQAALLVANKLLKKSVSELKQLNMQLAHKVIKRTTQYAFISHINQNIVHTNDQETLFRKSCTIAHEIGKFEMAWVGIFDQANKKIEVVEQCGIPQKDIPLFATMVDHGVQRQVLESGIYHLCNDLSCQPNIEKWKSFAQQKSIHSFMVLPIKRMGVVNRNV